MSEKKSTLMQKVQRFGGAMFTPVLFFAVFGIIVGFATLFKNNLVFGSLADPETTWYKVWDIIYNGANTVFKQMPLIFAIGLPVSLAKKQQARACLEIFVIYATFLYLGGGNRFEHSLDISFEGGVVSAVEEYAEI